MPRMTAHNYTISGHKRTDIARWLSVIAVFVVPLLPIVLQSFGQILPSTLPWTTKLAALSFSSATLYWCLYWLYNKFGWRLLDRLIDTPYVGGVWIVEGTSLNQDGTARFQWQGELSISQRWDEIEIHLATAQSASNSSIAGVSVARNGKVTLAYSYRNDPKMGEPELQKHQGFCELVFVPDRKSAEGYYFNSLGRISYGRMLIKKKEG
jgi:hypothetical protein